MILNILLALLPILGLGENAVAQQSQMSLKDDTSTLEKQYYVTHLQDIERVCDFECDGLFYEFADGDNVTLVREKSVFLELDWEVPYDRICEIACARDENLCYTGDITVPDSIEYNGKRYRVAYVNPYAFSICKGLRSVKFTSPIKNQKLDSKMSGCLFNYNPDLTSVIYHDDMKEIDSHFFISPSLEHIHFPKKLSSLTGSLRYLTLTEIDLDNHDTYNPSRFYMDYLTCSFSDSLNCVKMPECDTLDIKGFVYYYCHKASRIVFRPCSVIEMTDASYFGFPMSYGSKKMTVVSEGVTPPKVIVSDGTGNEVHFEDNYGYCAKSILYVPDEAMEAYGEAYYWCDFGEIRPMSEYLREENAAIDRPVCEAAEMAEPQISLRSDRGELRITASTPAEVTVWSLQGQALWQGTVMDEAVVTLPKGIYIVTTPTSSRKYRH